ALAVSTVLVWRAYEAESEQRQIADDNYRTAEEERRFAQDTVDDMYTQVAEKWLAKQPRLQPLQKEFLEKAIKYYQRTATRGGPQPELRLQTAKAHHRMAAIHDTLGHSKEAIDNFRESIALFTELAGEPSLEPDCWRELARSCSEMGNLEFRLGHLAEAEDAYRKSLDFGTKLKARFPDHAEYAYLEIGGRVHFAHVFDR